MVVPPVTEERMSVPGSLITGALSPVMAASLTEATPSSTSPSPGIRSPASTSTRSPAAKLGGRHRLASPSEEPLGLRVGARRAQRVGLGLAAPLRHRLGEVGEQYGEPEPQRHRGGEEAVGAQPGCGHRRRAQEFNRRDRGAHQPT